MPQLRAVIFDLDGVLVHTEDYHFQSWLSVARDRHLPLDRDTYDRDLRGLGRLEAAALLSVRAGIRAEPKSINEIGRQKNEVFQELVMRRPPDVAAGVPALFAELRQRQMGIAIASSSRNARLLFFPAPALNQEYC